MTRKSSKGCFPKGHVPWNKGRHFKAGGRSAETQFKNGTIPPNYQPVGAITTHSDGYRYIKLADRKWQLYQRYIWEQANHKKLKKSQAVLFLDGDRDNLSPDNLMVVSRKKLAIINHERLMTKNDAELSKTGILIAKLKIKASKKLKKLGEDHDLEK